MNLWPKLKTAVKYPAAARERIRSVFLPRFKIAPLIKDGIAEAPPPITLSLNLTHLCNLKCRMCGQWRRQDVYRKQSIPLDPLKRVIDSVSSSRPKIYLWGGEPLLYPELSALLDHLWRNNQYTIINTNGVLLKKFAAEIVDKEVAGLDISIDGPPEIHNRIRGVPRTFEKVMEGLLKLRESRQQKKTNKPMVKAVCTVSEINQDRLIETLKLLEDSNLFDAVIFNLGWFTTEKIGRATDRIFQKYLGCGSSSWKDFVGALGRVDPGAVRRLMDFSARRRGNLPVFFIPSLSSDRVEEYYQRPASFLGKKICYTPWLNAEVRPDGGVTFCPDFPDYIIGNIIEEPFGKIWNGRRAQKFRRLLIDRGLFPLCSRCCGLFAY